MLAIVQRVVLGI